MKSDNNECAARFRPDKVQSHVANVCGLEPGVYPVVSWDTTPPADPAKLEEQFAEHGIDEVLGLYSKENSAVTVYVERCRCFARAAGLEPDDVILIVFIHELCHRVHDLGKSKHGWKWETFWDPSLNNSEEQVAENQQIRSKRELLEKLAEWNSSLVLKQSFPSLIPSFEKLQELSPPIYKLGKQQRSKNPEDFREILLKASGRKPPQKEDLTEFSE